MTSKHIPDDLGTGPWLGVTPEEFGDYMRPSLDRLAERLYQERCNRSEIRKCVKKAAQYSAQAHGHSRRSEKMGDMHCRAAGHAARLADYWVRKAMSMEAVEPEDPELHLACLAWWGDNGASVIPGSLSKRFYPGHGFQAVLH